MSRKIMTGIALAAASALLLAGCSTSSDNENNGGADENVAEDGSLVIGGQLVADAETLAKAKEEGSLIFYTGGSEVSEREAADAFTAATGIQVEIVRLAPNKLNERILSEHAANQLAADVIRISGEDLIAGLAAEGTFTTTDLTDDIAGALIDTAVLEDGLYFSSFDRVYSFAYNNQIVSAEDAPKSWADLTDEKWAGVQGVTQVGAGGSTAALTRFQFDVLGEQWLRDIAATNPRIYDSSAALTDGLTRGEISVGWVPIATAYSAALDGAPITIVMPTEGAAAYPFYLGQTSSAKNSAAATVFINWLLSTDGQNLAASLGDFPANTDANNPTVGEMELPPSDSDLVFRSTLDESLDNLKSDAELWTTIFGYTG